MSTTRPEKVPKLNTISALITVVLYLVGSIVAGVLAAIFFGGVGEATPDARNIDGLIDNTTVAYLIVLAVLIYVCLRVFKGSSRRIFLEEKAINRPRYYYLFPLLSFGVSVFALTQVDYSAFSVRDILLVIVATLAIGANEEIVTRGILLVGLRNSGVREWLVFVVTLVVFSLLHLVNLTGGANPIVLVTVLTGGTLWYVSRRVFGNLFVPIFLHALWDTAFFLLPGATLVSESLPDHVLDIQLASFLTTVVGAILVLFVGRSLFQRASTSQT